jgi:hypothetical protein
VTPERDTPERERPPGWGDPAPLYEKQPESSAHEGRREPPSDGSEIPSSAGRAGLSPDEISGEIPYETGRNDPDGSVEQNEDGKAGLGGYNPPDSSGYEYPGITGDLTRHPFSPNGSRAAGNGQVSAQAWPVGVGHATVTKRREHRILRGVRSGVVLTVIALALGVATAASLGVIVWLIATAIHHAASN